MKVSFIAIILFLILPLGAAGFDFAAGLAGENWADNYLVSSQIKKLNSDRELLNDLIQMVTETSNDWRIRIRGIRVLGDTGNPKAADVLMEMYGNSFINNACPAIKTSLADVLGNFPGDTRVVSALIDGLDDPELQVREAAVLSLGRLGDIKAGPFLIKVLAKDKSLAVRVNAVRALAMIGEKEAIPYLNEIVTNSEDLFLREVALAALARMDDISLTSGR